MSLAGCAELSGLGSLEVGDATTPITDATSEDAVTTTDAIGNPDVATDAKPDASDASDAVISPDVTFGACKSPADCKNAEVCCETFDTSGQGQPPNCNVDADTIGCASTAQCPTSVSFTCADKDVFRRCIATADCTENTYNKCCTGKIGAAGTRTVCLSSLLAQAIDASCL
jgi:hypothetical protein